MVVSQREFALGNSHLTAETENWPKILGEQRLWLMSLDTRENHLGQAQDCQGKQTRPGSDPHPQPPLDWGPWGQRGGGEAVSHLCLPGTDQGPGTESQEVKDSVEER